MYEKDGEKYFIVDSHSHFWDASRENWKPRAPRESSVIGPVKDDESTVIPVLCLHPPKAHLLAMDLGQTGAELQQYCDRKTTAARRPRGRAGDDSRYCRKV